MARRKPDLPKQAEAEAKLKTKQQAFVEAYLTNGFNATAAARTARYAHPNTQGPRLLVNVGIRVQIDARLAEMRMGADEVLARLTDQATATMADFIKPLKTGAATLDMAKAQRLGKLHLLKKFKVGVDGTAIELYDAQAALEKLGRYHKLFVERHELSGKDGGPIETRITEVVVELPQSAGHA